MKALFNISNDQISINKQLWFHFYPGILITLFYIVLSPLLINKGLPGLAILLIAEIVILAPTGLSHLLVKGRKINGKISFKNVIGYTQKLSLKQYLKWSSIGFGLCLLVYMPLYPLGIFIRENVFAWLPPWYFNPNYGTENLNLLAKVFLFGILVDGFVGPIVEELFFRGYLLPRMAYLKKWAPILNGALFGLYHFWQPHNYLSIIGVGIVLSWVTWKTKNVYVGIIVHCTLNIIGAIGGYLAVSSGEIIAR